MKAATRAIPKEPRIDATLARLLQETASRLRSAANGKLSAKSLHQLRISIRRAEAALSLCRRAVPRPPQRWLKRRLTKVRRVCNPSRDLDVLRDRLDKADVWPSGRLRRTLQRKRQDRRQRIVKIVRQMLRHDEFERESKLFVKQVRKLQRSSNMPWLIGQELFRELHRFVSRMPARRPADGDLHRLRITSKRLRYAAELVCELWPAVDLTEIIEMLHSLQDRLGAIRDLRVGANHLTMLCSQHSRPSVQPLVQKSLRNADRRQREFWRWWNQLPLERMLADATAELALLLRRRG